MWGMSWDHSWLHNQFPSFFSVLHCPLGLGELQTCPFLDVPTSFSVCLVFFPLSLCLAIWFWPDVMNGRHVYTTSVCVSLQWSEGLCVVRLSAGSWHRHSLQLPCEGPWFRSIQEDGCDKGARQSYLATKRNTTVIPKWFQPCESCCCLCYPGVS